MTLPVTPTARKVLSARRIVLLASTVAGVGALVLLGSPSDRPIEFRTSAALAAETVHPQAGFGDLIERVKPAVFAVRVKIDENAKQTSSREGRSSCGPASAPTPAESPNSLAQSAFSFTWATPGPIRLTCCSCRCRGWMSHCG